MMLLLAVLAMLVTTEGRTQPVEMASLGFRVETEVWEGGAWRYGSPQAWLDLEIGVDEHSGEDGALAPTLYLAPLRPLPDLRGLPGRVFDDGTARIEAWYGNDAPELLGNRFRIVDFPARDRARVEWTATYDGGKAFRFEGVVPFSGIVMKVKKAEDAPRLLREAWPALDQSRLECRVGPTVDFGEMQQPDRRRWVSVSFVPKG